MKAFTLLPALMIGGISYAPGTWGQITIVPVLDSRREFTLENLPPAAGVPELAILVAKQERLEQQSMALVFSCHVRTLYLPANLDWGSGHARAGFAWFR
jgi:hypothetical protein